MAKWFPVALFPVCMAIMFVVSPPTMWDAPALIGSIMGNAILPYLFGLVAFVLSGGGNRPVPKRSMVISLIAVGVCVLLFLGGSHR